MNKQKTKTVLIEKYGYSDYKPDKNHSASKFTLMWDFIAVLKYIQILKHKYKYNDKITC